MEYTFKGYVKSVEISDNKTIFTFKYSTIVEQGDVKYISMTNLNEDKTFSGLNLDDKN